MNNTQHTPQAATEPHLVHVTAPTAEPIGTNPCRSGTPTAFNRLGAEAATRRELKHTAQREIRHSDFDRPFYTVPQAAEVLQVHENTIYNLVRAGKVEHYKVGVQIRIAASELERLKVERTEQKRL